MKLTIELRKFYNDMIKLSGDGRPWQSDSASYIIDHKNKRFIRLAIISAKEANWDAALIPKATHYKVVPLYKIEKMERDFYIKLAKTYNLDVDVP